MKVIDRFKGDFDFLSNFYVLPSGRTVEHYYQAEKTDDLEWKFVILEAGTPWEARRLGRQAPLKKNWDALRIPVMEPFVGQKFSLYPLLARLLVNTGNVPLIEGNTWGDTFWGVCNGVGENHLGKILMKNREKHSQKWKTAMLGR